MYEIVKRVDFSFGHRLVDYDGKCNRPHGHNGVAEIRLSAETLDEAGMVADFGDVGDAVGGWIDSHLDHRMILRADDPLAPAVAALGEDAYLMAEEPTAENMARMIYGKVSEMGLPVVSVTLWETSDSRATYAPLRAGSEVGDGVVERKTAFV